MTYRLADVDIGLLALHPANAKPSLQERQQMEHVHALAASLRDPDVGPLQPPIVHVDTMEILAGGDRVAAHLLLGHETITVSLREADRRATTKIILAENAHRRHEPERQQEELIRLYELALADEIEREHAIESEARPRPRGRPSTPAGRAAAAVAKQKGLKPNSVTKAVERHAEKLARYEAVQAGDTEALERLGDPAFSIELFDTDPPGKMLVQVALLKRKVWKAQKYLNYTARLIGEAVALGYGMREDHAKAVARDVNKLRSRVFLLEPTMVCLPCVGEGCEQCDGRGWLDGVS